jgi:uncharacterized membrane protein YvbJ
MGYEPDSCGEECLTTLDDRKEEFSIQVEKAEIKVEESDIKVEEADIKIESVDIKEQNPEAKNSPPINTQPEVSVWGLCVRQQQFILTRPFTATNRERPKIQYFRPIRCSFYSPKNVT